MDLISRNELLEIIDTMQRKFGNHMVIRWKELRYLVNKMPSVVPDELWEANTDDLEELITKE